MTRDGMCALRAHTYQKPKHMYDYGSRTLYVVHCTHYTVHTVHTVHDVQTLIPNSSRNPKIIRSGYGMARDGFFLFGIRDDGSKSYL
jgi:hypothetical protein